MVADVAVHHLDPPTTEPLEVSQRPHVVVMGLRRQQHADLPRVEAQGADRGLDEGCRFGGAAVDQDVASRSRDEVRPQLAGSDEMDGTDDAERLRGSTPGGGIGAVAAAAQDSAQASAATTGRGMVNRMTYSLSR